MTVKQTIIKFFYPVIKTLSGLKDKESAILVHTSQVTAFVSFYSLKATLNNKSAFDFSSLKGKKVLLVNLASDCGFTAQYEELEKLNQLYKSSLTVLGFPANDFKGQEPGNDEEIEKFCRINYSVTFPIFTKAPVLKPAQQEVFDWLSSKEKNGWNNQPPAWNFSKYLVDEDGNLQGIFKSHISPLNVEVLKMIETPAAGNSKQITVNEKMLEGTVTP